MRKRKCICKSQVISKISIGTKVYKERRGIRTEDRESSVESDCQQSGSKDQGAPTTSQ